MLWVAFAWVAGWHEWWIVTLFGIVGALQHAAGFSDNNVANRIFDQGEDEYGHKRAHQPLKNPIVTGDISLRNAKLVVIILTISTVGLFIYLDGLAGWRVLPLVFLLGYAVCGWTYNRVKQWPKIPSHLLMGTSYFCGAMAVLSTGNPGLLFLPLGVWAGYGLAMTDNIVAGDGKDIEDLHEPNLLRDLGARVEGGTLRYSKKAAGLVYGLGLGRALSLMWVGYTIYPMDPTHGTLWFYGVFLSGVVAMFYVLHRMVATQPWDRVRHMRWVGILEVGWSVTLVLTLSPLLGWALSLFVILAPLAVFWGSNKIVWNSETTLWAGKV
jgi:4-hydroxybenzoate polyprenyltransferase